MLLRLYERLRQLKDLQRQLDLSGNLREAARVMHQVEETITQIADYLDSLDGAVIAEADDAAAVDNLEALREECQSDIGTRAAAGLPDILTPLILALIERLLKRRRQG